MGKCFENEEQCNNEKVQLKEKVQLAVYDVLNGYLLLGEAIEKYGVSSYRIIQELKKIQKNKDDF